MSKYVKIVYLKEMLDAFRDRRTILSSLLIPLILYPLMFSLMNFGVAGMVEDVEEKTTVAVIAEEAANQTVMDILAQNPAITIKDSQDPMGELKNGDLTLVLRGSETLEGKLNVEIIFDDKKNNSSMAVSLISGLVAQYGQAVVERSLAEQGINLEALNPVTQSSKTLSEETGAVDGGNAGMMISMMGPMLIVILLAVGGMAVAGDLFAGEKERKTMEPLLCTRAGRSAILSGKLLAVTTFALLNVIASAAGLVIAYVVSPGVFNLTDEVTGAAQALNIPIPVILLTLGLVLLMALVFSGIHVVIATYARTTKESATYGTFIMFASYIPVFSTMFMGAGDVKQWMMFVPVLNVTGCLKMILGGITNYTFLFGSIGVSLVFLVAVMALARWMFTRETIMLRTTG